MTKGITHIAIDIDGTITKHPKEFLELMLALKPNHRVTVLTGSIGQGIESQRVQQLKSLGISENAYTSLVIAVDASTQGVADKKGQFCRDQKVDMIFEDTPMYLEAIKRISPSTCCFLIFN